MSAAAPISALDRSLAAFRALVLSVYPAAVYWITHEYEVVESDGATFSGTPTDAAFSPPLPTHVPYSPALAGASCVVPPGTLAYVAFANADPAKPFLVRFGQPSTATAIGLANAALYTPGQMAAANVAAYRLALDHPGRLEKLATLDIVSTHDMWHRIDAQFAFRIWHWTFLALPAPFPEETIGRDPVAFWERMTAPGPATTAGSEVSRPGWFPGFRSARWR
jgi:hypothetical protein